MTTSNVGGSWNPPTNGQQDLRARETQAITPVCVDGGARLRFDAAPGGGQIAGGSVSMAAWLEGLRAVRDREGQAAWRESGGDLSTIQVPGFGPVVCAFAASGQRRQIVTCHLADAFHLTWDVEAGTASLEAKAPALWAAGAGLAGWEHWRSTWAVGVARWLGIDPAAWRVCALDLCADFTGFGELTEADASLVVGARKRDTIRAHSSATHPGIVETLDIGTRASNVSLCVYDKTAEIRAKGRGDIYAPMHTAYGWDGHALRHRVEVRLRGPALVWRTPRGIVDLRDPSALTSEIVGEVWRVVTRKRRMVQDGAVTRRRRADTQARWTVVQAAADVPEVDATAWVQSRAVEARAYERRVALSRRAVERAIVRHAVMVGAPLDTVSRHRDRRERVFELAERVVAAALRDGGDNVADRLVLEARDVARDQWLVRDELLRASREWAMRGGVRLRDAAGRVMRSVEPRTPGPPARRQSGSPASAMPPSRRQRAGG